LSSEPANLVFDFPPSQSRYILTLVSPVLGEDEIAQGKVKIKENGLRADHPEKSGVDVDLSNLVSEVKARIKRKSEIDALVINADGLRVSGGSKKEEETPESAKEEVAPAEAAKSAEETPSQEVVGSTPGEKPSEGTT
jgi:histidyl-tRNA synthetase